MSFRFRKFKVYQDALEAYRFVIFITKKFPQEYSYLRTQIRRAALSVILNIAEGSAKTSDRDFNRYLGNSLGSVNEVVAGLEVAFLSKLIKQHELERALKTYQTIANQLGGFSKRLKS